MSRSIPIRIVAKKGAAPRVLKVELDRTREALTGQDVPAGMLRALDAAQTAANKLITAAQRSDQVEVSISIVDTPLGGWGATVMVDVPTPTYPER